MVLVKSSSGIRGTLGGKIGDSFTPIDAMKFSSAYVSWMRKKYKHKKKFLILSGRDGRITSKLFHTLLLSTLQSLGIDVIDIGLSTTPTLAFSIINEKADGGIMITASHNPKNWNGLKMFNSFGEFLSEKEFQKLCFFVKKQYFYFSSYKKFGKILYKTNCIQKHIEKVISLPIVDTEKIRKSNLKIVVDGINSTGGIAVPLLLENLGVHTIKMYCNPHGNFSHNPEPVQNNLKNICKKVPKTKSNMGISIDPDVDRVVFICENGDFFGEENTLVAITDYVLKHEKGPIVTTYSSSHALKDLSITNGVPFYFSPVGEVHVVKRMKEVHAIIGGEGNGGIIYPTFRYGRDALVGIALFLTYISKEPFLSLSVLKKKYSKYFMSKRKVRLLDHYSKLIQKIKKKYNGYNMDFNDGIKIYLSNKEWIHIRKSNTENMIRIYTESYSRKRANFLSRNVLYDIKKQNTNTIK
ncbi:phosphoglucosamine mutase [Blattabacterium cuenoti]|uniref:phosphoglucosamine mutase n=1 Tax=Blattabacterium cuenoti TaxID=1653831 RepID=UPI00163D28CA|nr:phosphoglucosamine mutase [Blattabacterium cuenoti]